MRPRDAVLFGVVTLLAGCVYYNALYNAEHLFDEAEAHRRAGRDSLAVARFAQVIDKAAKGFRSEPRGPWADDALLLMGRAHLRRGDLRAARAALRQAAQLAESEEGRLGAVLYLGVSHIVAGDVQTGAPLINEALQGLRSAPLLAEGHLWRARIFLEAGQVDAGWWDLDRAASVHSSVRLDAALERTRWGIVHGDPERVGEGLTRLMALGEAADRVDTIAALAHAAADRWGAEGAASLLSGADTARWARTQRGRIRLVRARLLSEAGDTAASRRVVEDVADGFGVAAAEARLALARDHLASVADLAGIRRVLPLLLPAGADPEVRRLLDDLDLLERQAEMGLDDPLGWFAAAETARDRLGAPALARGLFLAYVDAAPSDPWAAKALLAAMDVSPDVGDREWLRGRLGGRGNSPYVMASRGEPAPDIEALEEELARRLERIRRP